jgi:hypothetical protein
VNQTKVATDLYRDPGFPTSAIDFKNEFWRSWEAQPILRKPSIGGNAPVKILFILLVDY